MRSSSGNTGPVIGVVLHGHWWRPSTRQWKAVIMGAMTERDAFAPVRLIGAQLAFLLKIGWDGIGGYTHDADVLPCNDLERCKAVS